MAFYRCERVKSITLPNSIERIDDNAFAYCSNLTNVNFSNNLTTLEEEVFEGCTQLANINLPDSVVSIGKNAFKDTLWYDMQEDGLVYAGKVLYTYKGNIPENSTIVLKNDTKGIADGALSFQENIKNIVLPYGLKHIGEDSLEGLTVSSIDIPSTVESFGNDAFSMCKNIEEIKLPSGIKEIPNGMFSWCSNLKRANVPNGVTCINDWAFHDSSLESVIIPNSVTRIGKEAFSGTGISDVVIGANVKRIEENAFTSNNLDGCTYVGSEEQWNNIYVDYGSRMLDTSNDCLIPVTFLNLSDDISVVSVVLNNKHLKFDFPAIIVNGRTLVPLRAIFEALGATVEWDGSTQTVTSTLKGTTLKLTIGSNVLYKNGTPITLDVPAQLINNRTMVPVRAVSDAFGANVKWDGDTRTVYISTQGKLNALIINADAELTDNDAALMRETLLNNKLLPIDEQNFHIAFEPTRDYFNRIIDVLIQQAAENDITYFYYSGHGGSDGSISPTYNHETRNGSFSLTPNELAEIFNKIPGTVVVILDSCYSGTITTCDLDTDKFKILTASGNSEFSNASDLEAFIPFTDERLGEFTEVLLNGLGGLEGNNIIYNTITGRDGKVKADYDKNHQVTLSELFRYTTENISGNQHPSVSDENDQTVIYAY